MSFIATCVATIIIVFIGTICFAITSFGGDIIFQIGWQLCFLINSTVCNGDLTSSLGIITLVEFIKYPIQVQQYYKYVNWNLTIKLSSAEVLGTITGLLILSRFGENGLLKCGLGVVMLLIVIWQISNLEKEDNYNSLPTETSHIDTEATSTTYNPIERGIQLSNLTNTYESRIGHVDIDSNDKNSDDSDDTHEKSKYKFHLHSSGVNLVIFLAAYCAGILGGMYGTSGPPFMVLANMLIINKNEWIGSICISYLFENITRFIYLAIVEPSAFSVDSSESWSDVVGFAFGTLIVTILGIALGNMIGFFVDIHLWRKMLVGLLIMGSVLMIYSGLQ